jgi:type IV pilus assembly protein PilX
MKREAHTLREAQRGVSLIVVMVVLVMGSLLMLGSTRVGTLHQALVGSESDTQLAFAAAEALIRDAELDILGQRADGTPCSNDPTVAAGCRALADPFFPEEDDDLDLLGRSVSSGSGFRNCRQGICLPGTVNELDVSAWTTDLARMQAVGATYGQFTGTATAAASNPLLTNAPARAWYWVEVFRYSDAGGILAPTGSRLAPDMVRHPYVYRITAYVQGNKPGTRVQLRSVLVPFPNPRYQH